MASTGTAFTGPFSKGYGGSGETAASSLTTQPATTININPSQKVGKGAKYQALAVPDADAGNMDRTQYGSKDFLPKMLIEHGIAGELIGDDACPKEAYHKDPCKKRTLKACVNVGVNIGLGYGELNWAALFLTLLCEMLGLTLVIVAGAGTYAGTYLVVGGGVAGTALGIVAGSFAFAFALSAAMIIFGLFSGQGHFNPGISILMRVFGHTSTWTMLAAIIGQLIASFLAALILLAIFGSGPELDLTTTVVDPYSFGFTIGVAIVVELFGGIVLHFCALRLAQTQIGSVLTALFMGFVFLFVQLFGAPFTGGSYNFFRTLGVAVLSGNYNPVVAASWWIYPVMHLASVAIAGLLEWIMLMLWRAKHTNSAKMMSKMVKQSDE